MSVISTIEARCRDCYKCVRYCPVKAIRVIRNHAEVVAERCIGDGRCVIVCPQRAKKVESGIEAVVKHLKSQSKVAVSLAPSFVSAFEGIRPGQLFAALKNIGFDYVEETAAGAEYVARKHAELAASSGHPVFASCCPAIVKLIERYYPEKLPYLAEVVSPMVAHARMLKAKYGAETKVVFIGPCIAKKDEGHHFEEVDAVLSFQELEALLEQYRLDLNQMEDMPVTGDGIHLARNFPAPGGLAKTASLSTDLLAKAVISIDGLDETIEFLEHFDPKENNLKLVELLACRGGCLSGPGMPNRLGLYQRRHQLLNYVEEAGVSEVGEFTFQPELGRQFSAHTVETEPTEEEIREILSRTGKYTAEDELNCGACGYNSCREKAVAVAKGMAEVDMCIPYMREKAESKANIICQMTPNAIFVVDKELRILEVNPAAELKFCCKQEKVVGAKLSSIFDPLYFNEAFVTKELITGEVSFPAYGLVAWQAIFYVEKEEVIIGIFADITREKQQRERLDRVTEETLAKAQEVIDKQMRVAQEIAGLLGETTAETKVQLTKLMKLIQNEAGKGR
ncbi:MAG TPA: [Fe-Fe] hydrogenase large subunit C-terminal domain-containing protein [Bacillota bacterium]|nr:[Fe-Fe] hydrogenase large subunit C-terminal domain-containing protein [Bacillota bacterium]HPT87444.1 [Fe-Fe] hydrogenase large subunit C-terminal domain-containing protein [Bacillota bacterium]